MSIITRFEYTGDKQVTAQIADEIDDFLWVAFAKDTNGNCILEKQAKFNITQTYFSLEREVDQINALDVDSSNLYVAYEDSLLFGEIISKTNPLTITTDVNKESGITESPIDIKVNGADLWFLLPGNATATNAQLLRYNTSGVLQETVDLIKTGEIINNASSMTIDSNGDIWLITNESPVKLVRVYEVTGGHDFSVTEIV